MTTTLFRSVRAAALLAALLILSVHCGQAFAQDNKAAPVYNTKGASGTGAAPLFLNKKASPQASGLVGGVLPSRKAYGMNSTNVASSPQNMQKAAKQFEENAARQQALNKQLRDSRTARIRAEFDATRAREDAADAQRLQQEALQRQAAAEQAGVGPREKLPNAATAPSAAPYAGSNVVFTGRKKDGEQKPVRRFNMR